MSLIVLSRKRKKRKNPNREWVTPMKIAAAYVRVSTDDQLEYSPDSQLQAIRGNAKAHGLTPAGTLRHTYLEGPPQHKDPARFVTQVALAIRQPSAQA